MIFSIDAENNITAFATTEQVPANTSEQAPLETFSSQAEFATLSKDWPLSRLVAVSNSIPGGIAVKKFKDRQMATSRIWKAIRGLSSAGAPETAQVAPLEPKSSQKASRRPKATKAKAGSKVRKTAAKPGRQSGATRDGSKKVIILDLLRRKGGASLQHLMDATGWQAHSVRGFLSGTVGKKMGLELESTKTESGERIYRLG